MGSLGLPRFAASLPDAPRFGWPRLGLRAGMISRVGDDHLGRFLVETIAREGCDVSHVSVDPSRLTGAVVLGIKDRDTFPLIFYRERCADMALSEEDIDPALIARARSITPKDRWPSMRPRGGQWKIRPESIATVWPVIVSVRHMVTT